ncbi:MAG: epimerase [Candidatus Marinimicrobia bacterium]|nr:epimerase [Candidatus Neomarinimicrobiota bacterium]|tara:strand:- start:5879 stop:6808 length:930 start_codon:yes stop_codon:yes gene_type:complete
MKVALFGGTGFVGSYITESLIEAKHNPNILVRENSKKRIFRPNKCKVFLGDINNSIVIKKLVEESDVIIYNIGIIREFPKKGITFKALHFEALKRCVDIAKSKGISRFILMSANGIDRKSTGYETTKYNAEEYLKKSGLNFTIFRPSLVFGKPKLDVQNEFCLQLKKDMLSLPLPIPLFYKGVIPNNVGLFKLSPIHVKNVADFFVKSISNSGTIGKTYRLGGEKSYSWKEIISTISRACKKNKWAIPVPIFPIKIAATFLDSFEWFPVTKDQITMLVNGNTTDKSYFNQFGISPIDFKQNNLTYLSDK